MFEVIRERETPALGSRATLCAVSLVPLPRQRSMGTCGKAMQRLVENAVHACFEELPFCLCECVKAETVLA